MKVRADWFSRGAQEAAGAGDLVVVVDILRSSSFVATALAIGAEAVRPVVTVREALQLHRSPGPLGNALLAGEIDGVKVEGFDFGNSPTELLSREGEVRGRTLILRSTMGTKAIQAAKACGADPVAVGCILNARTVAAYAYSHCVEHGRDMSVICCGFPPEQFAVDDFLGAGAIIAELPEEVERDDAALAAHLAFEAVKEAGELLDVVSRGRSAKLLHEIGEKQDIRFCLQPNRYDVLPLLRNYFIKKA